MTRVEAGMRVRHQNAWPSQERDLLSILDRFGRLMPVGFYYKTFHTPKLFWKAARPIIRQVAGLGRVGQDPSSGRRTTTSSGTPTLRWSAADRPAWQPPSQPP